VERLPFQDASFDSVVDTFSLCVFPRPGEALRELARVLRPGGRLLLLEHSRSSSPLLAAYQDATNGAVAAMSKGCAWNQDVEALLAGAGLRPLRLERYVAGTVVLVQAELLVQAS
jgi:ubiquinone/menaquinone biosynthesis C-methylase UbiE